MGGAVPQVGGVVPPPAGKLFFEDRPLDGGQRVSPSKSARDDEELDAIYDEHGYVYCAHGHEQCELCRADHRLAALPLQILREAIVQPARQMKDAVARRPRRRNRRSLSGVS